MAERLFSRQSFGRRGFLASVVAGFGSLGLSGQTIAQSRSAAETELDALSFYSSASQIAPDGESELADEDTVVVWAEPSAHNFETTDDGPETVVYEDEDIPLVSEDGQVVGVGTADFVSDDNGGFDLDNEEFALNLFDAKMGGSGTVLWDEGHDQFGGLALSNYDSFRQYAANAGYDLESSTELLGDASLTFRSTASQVAADGGPLTDGSHAVVWAESTATNVDDDGDEASHLYGEDEEIPLVSRDGDVVGIGTAELLEDDHTTEANERFALNLLADTIGGSGTVLWDDAHDSFYDASAFGEFAAALEDAGYEFEAVDELLSDGDGSDPVDPSDTLSVDPATPGEPSTHTWTLEDVEFGEAGNDGDEVNELTVEYGDASLDGLTNDDVTVTMTRTLSGGEDTSEISVNQGTYDGSTATFDLNGAAQTDVAGPVVVEVDGVENPETSETATITLEGDAEPVSAEAGLVVGTDGNAAAERENDGDGIDADALFVPSPAESYTDAELAALDAHLADGGALFLLDEAEFVNEETANLNAIADHLDLAFRFNADQVEDEENNTGQPFHLATANFNDGFEGFEGRSLENVDGLVVASPGEAFTSGELSAVSAFVDDGGALFLLDESDFGGQGNTAVGFDETENLNAIADHLDLAFRFNSDQVNDGDEFDITTTNVNTDFDYFDHREDSIGIDFERGETYYGRVVRVFDGDTFEVEFDSEYDFRDVIRHLGIDTAETAPATNDPEEWFGIEDLDHLDTWGEEATQFSLDVMAPDAEAGETDVEGRRVAMEFDTIEPLRGNFGRLLMYMYYDPDDFDAGPDGDYSVDYNLETVEEGYARVYSSGFARHDEFAAAEEDALAAGRGVWSAADFDALEEVRNDPVEEVFVPRASSITTSSGPLSADRAPVLASETADQESLGNGDVQSYSNAPLVGVDEDRSVGMVGGVLIDEAYEDGGAVDVDTSGFGNFPFLTNLATYLSDNDGDFLLEGGHAQFDVDGSISLERAQFYLRFVEGVGSRLRQINDVVNTLPEEDEPTAVFLTAPGRAYTDEELAALADYRDAGGAVVLLGSTEASAENRANLDDVAAGLGSDLRLNGDRIVDAGSNLADDPELPVTGEFDEAFPLFEPVGEMPAPPVEELVVRSENHDAIDVGDVLGDVVVTGSSEVDGTITIDGDVGGDIVLDGASRVAALHVAGDVDGTVRLTGNAAVEGDIVLDGTVGDLTLRGNPAVGGDLVLGVLEGDVDERGTPSINGDVLVEGEGVGHAAATVRSP
jgi:endonuclease YncB( thermonuclease family)